MAQKASTLTVKSSSFGVTTEDVEDIEVREFLTDASRVTISVGHTANLGDFASIRADVTVSIPCYVEEVKQVTRKAEAYAVSVLNKTLQDLESKMHVIKKRTKA